MYWQMKKFLGLYLSDIVLIMLINVKMPTIVGILTFTSRIKFLLSWVEYEKSFITLGPVHDSYFTILQGLYLCKAPHLRSIAKIKPHKKLSLAFYFYYRWNYWIFISNCHSPKITNIFSRPDHGSCAPSDLDEYDVTVNKKLCSSMF